MFAEISAVQVYLRAGWSLGNVQDRYIFAGPGGDELVGRAVAGLPFADIGFSVLPPHFSPNDLAELEAIGWENIIDNYKDFPSGTQQIIPYLLASIVYHQDFLETNLRKDHPLKYSKLYASSHNILARFKGKVLTGYGTCRLTNMQATGIPTCLRIMHSVRQFQSA
jgi:hypothetical protein